MNCHFATGIKGGTGKSFLARTLAQYLIDKKHPFIAFDTDRSNPDLKRMYGQVMDVQLGIFGEGQQYEDTANQIYNAAIESDVLVNCPAQVEQAQISWFEKNALMEIAEEDGVKFTFWFVSDGGFDSLNLLAKHLNYFGNRVNHVVVRNHGTGGDDWSHVTADQTLQELIVSTEAVVIDLPRFHGNSTRNRIDQEDLTFGKAMEFDGFKSLEKQRVRSSLRDAYTQIESAKML